jgi:HK97 family phage portal protein
VVDRTLEAEIEACVLMGIISRSLGIQNFSFEDPAQPLLPYSALAESLGLGRSDAGIMVNEKSAMRLATAYGCIKVISEDLSRLSLDIFQTMPDDSMRLAKEHRCYPILHNRPNPLMSSMVWRAAMNASVCAFGNGYSWIKRDGAARVISLIPLDASKTSPVRINGVFQFATTQTENGQVAYIDVQHMLHFMNYSLDGITGLSPIGMCKNAFGLGLAAEKFGALFFGNGARATGIFSHPDILDPEARENLAKSVRERANGDNALSPMVLEEGLKWTQLTIPPNEAQFIEARQHQKAEIACLYRVPMHLLQDLQRATNNNIEHQGLDYVRFCLAPRAVNMEQEINYKLLGGPYVCEHNFMDLTRGDFASQTAGMQTLRNIGVYSANDILRQMRQSPIPTDEGGDVRTVQGAMIPLSSLLAEEDKPAVPETAGVNSDEGNPAADIRERRIFAAYRPLFRDAVGRIGKRANPQMSDHEKLFARRAIYPLVMSMTEAMLAMRFGSCTLTERNEKTAGELADRAAASCAIWAGRSKTEIANELTQTIYAELAKEILA